MVSKVPIAALAEALGKDAVVAGVCSKHAAVLLIFPVLAGRNRWTAGDPVAVAARPTGKMPTISEMKWAFTAAFRQMTPVRVAASGRSC